MRGLKSFILNFQVKRLYYRFVKTAYKMESKSDREELVLMVRGEFESRRNVTEEADIKYLLTYGEMQLKTLESRFDQTR